MLCVCVGKITKMTNILTSSYAEVILKHHNVCLGYHGAAVKVVSLYRSSKFEVVDAFVILFAHN